MKTTPLVALTLAISVAIAGWAGVGPAFAGNAPELHGLRLGQLADGLDAAIDLPTGPTVGSMPNQLTWIAGPDNRLTHVIVSLQMSEVMSYEEQKDALYADMTARHGPADAVTLSPHEPFRAVWKDPQGRFEYSLQSVEGDSFSRSFVIMLESSDPARLCGPEDGFRDWFADWQAAIRANDKDGILARFHVPFFAVDFLPEVAPFGVETRAELENLWGSAPFNDFLAGVLAVDPGPIGKESGVIACNILPEEGNIQGYSVYLGDAIAYLPLVVDRVGPTWVAQGIAYQP